MSVSTWHVSHYCDAQCQDLKCLDQKVRPGVLGTDISHPIQRGKKKNPVPSQPAQDSPQTTE